MRHLTAAIIGVALLAGIASTASAQRWKYPPGPPYRSCPDTLTIFSIQQTDTTLAPCHPATLDTVWGVQGIVTGFDLRGGSYAVYMQEASGNAFTGINVFTGGTNYNGSVPGTPSGGNLQLGDRIAVYGTTQEFPASNGETEIEGPDVSQSTNDIIIRRLSSGNPLPPFRIGTTNNFNWVPTSPGNQGEQYEGMLVRIRGPLRVGRVGPGAGLFANDFLVVSVAAPSDSVMIDGFTLPVSPIGAPAVGTVIDSIQGILNQRNGQNSVNSYRIQLRNGNDMFLAAPPSLADAYPIEDNVIRVVFDRNVDVATAQDEGKYSLGSGIDGSTVDLATVVGGSGQVVDLTITSVLTDGESETITTQGIGSAGCPTCLSASQTLAFVNGVLTVQAVQAPHPDSLLGSPCIDRSRFAGPGVTQGARITVRGVGVQGFGNLYYMQDAGGGVRSGISIFGPSTAIVAGRKYRVSGRIQEFGGETEIVNTVSILDEGAQANPAPITKSIAVLRSQTCDTGQNQETGEDYEGVLVRIDDAVVVPFANPPTDPVAGGSFLIAQPVKAPTDTILVSSVGNYDFDADPGDIVDVTGVLHEDGTFRILPRSDADIVFQSTGVGDGVAVDLALSVKPNPGTLHRISYSLPKKGAVELGVYDLSGRRVATVASGVMDAGTHHAVWNGMGSNGARVGAGMYFYKLKLGNETRTLRAVKLN